MEKSLERGMRNGAGAFPAMPFVPSGKKAKRKAFRRSALSEHERDQIIDVGVGAVRSVLLRRGTCLQQSVLLERVLSFSLPEDRFTLRLGSLRVYDASNHDHAIAYDPRGPEGVDGGFHAWVADRRGEIVDPSITITLAADGFAVDPETVLQCMSPRFETWGLRFDYEELEGLELLRLAESEPYLAIALRAALYGVGPPHGPVVVCPLDVGWKPGAR